MRIKIFVSMWYGDLEVAVNKWLQERDDSVNVIDVKITKEDTQFIIIVQYKEKIDKPIRVSAESFDFDYEESN